MITFVDFFIKRAARQHSICQNDDGSITLTPHYTDKKSDTFIVRKIDDTTWMVEEICASTNKSNIVTYKNMWINLDEFYADP